MKKTDKGIETIMKAMRLARTQNFEFKYYRKHDGTLNSELISKYRCMLESALGAAGKKILENYTDCLIEFYKTDSGYFYDRGFDDCQKFYSDLFGLVPVSRIEGGDETNSDLINLVADSINDDKMRNSGQTLVRAAEAAWCKSKNDAAKNKTENEKSDASIENSENIVDSKPNNSTH